MPDLIELYKIPGAKNGRRSVLQYTSPTAAPAAFLNLAPGE